MTIDAKRLAAAIDAYKAADGVHANRLSYVLERDDARRAAEAGKGVTKGRIRPGAREANCCGDRGFPGRLQRTPTSSPAAPGRARG